jgi:hypothetical protein
MTISTLTIPYNNKTANFLQLHKNFWSSGFGEEKRRHYISWTFDPDDIRRILNKSRPQDGKVRE